MSETKTGLELLRVPFEKHQISKLPKPTKKQTDDLKHNINLGIRCKECGGWHHKDVIHLDYVGHAALTDRLLQCDPAWNWEPMSFTQDGVPNIDKNGGLWIKLTVCGVTRLGYGHPDGKTGGDAIKEVIGDALRNAAMRFGAALDLWHKGDLHKDESIEEKEIINPKAAIEGAKTEGVFQKQSGSLGDFKMTCGNANVKGKSLKDIDPAQLQSCVDYFLNQGKELTGSVKVSIHNAQLWFKQNQPPSLEEENLPF